jgi:hypothetical protein
MALSAIFLLRRQIWLLGSSVGKYLGPSANIWLGRQIIGSVGQFGFCGSSVGKYLDSAALSAIMSLRREIWLLNSSVGEYLGLSANIWLRQQIIGSVGQFGFCGSSVGKDLDPAALSAIMSLRRQIWLLGSSVGKYLGPLANIWLFGSIGSSVGE